MTWEIVFTQQAQKDAKKLAAAGLKPKALELLEILRKNPFQTPPFFEKLVGDLAGAYSRRINIKHRLVYEIREEEKVVKVIRKWMHYEWFRGYGAGATPDPSRTRKLRPVTPMILRGSTGWKACANRGK